MEAELPRRAFLGLAIREEKGRVVVTKVVSGSMGERAKLEIGDSIRSVEGEPIAGIEALMRTLRGAASMDSIALTYLRGNRVYERIVPVVPMPREAIDGCEVRYGQVESKGARLRTISIDPGDDAPILLYLQGIRCQSIDFALNPDTPIAAFVRGLAREGIGTIRVEKPGLGDSEGGPCDTIDFSTEVDAYAAVLRASKRPLFLFGHSVGGVIAPILAERFEVRGVIAYGTSSERWSAALRQGFARQWGLHGQSERVIAERLARFDAKPFEDLHGRSLAFHEDIEKADAAAAWPGVRAPVLIVIGEHDWVVGEDAQRAISAHVPHAEIEVLDGLDHAFTRHASVEASLRDYGTGVFDVRLVDACARFISRSRA